MTHVGRGLPPRYVRWHDMVCEKKPSLSAAHKTLHLIYILDLQTLTLTPWKPNSHGSRHLLRALREAAAKRRELCTRARIFATPPSLGTSAGAGACLASCPAPWWRLALPYPLAPSNLKPGAGGTTTRGDGVWRPRPQARCGRRGDLGDVAGA
jgi:hypothetical protein